MVTRQSSMFTPNWEWKIFVTLLISSVELGAELGTHFSFFDCQPALRLLIIRLIG